MKKFLAYLLVLTSCAFYVPEGFAEGEEYIENDIMIEEEEYIENDVMTEEEAIPDRWEDEFYMEPTNETEQEKDELYDHFEDFETQEGVWPPGWYFSQSAIYYGSRAAVKNGKLNLVHAGNGYQFRSNRKLDGVFKGGTVLVSFDLEIVKKAEKGDAFPKIGQEGKDAFSVLDGTTCLNFNADMFNFMEENDEGGKSSTNIPMKIEDGGKYKMGFVIDLDNKKQSFYMVNSDYEYYELTDRGFYDRKASYIDGIHFLMTSDITTGENPEYNIDNLRICQKDDVTYGEFKNMFFEENQMKTDRLEDIKYLLEKNDFMLMVDSPYCITKRKRVLVDENNDDVKPVIIGDSTMVPIRFISEKLGAEVSYNDAEEKVTINYKDKTIEIKIGESKLTLNGEEMQIPAPAIVKNDRTLVPLRSISEAFDKDVLWDDSGLITVCDNGQTVNEKINKEKGRIIKTFGIYVSPSGDDNAAGTKTNPLKTFDGAKELVKKLRTTSGIPEGGITVWFEGGTYFLESGIMFDEADSGSAESPINYRVMEGHEAELTSAVRLEESDFKRVTDESILERLYPTVRNKVLAVDLKKKGFTKINSLKHYRSSYIDGDEERGYAMLVTDGYNETLARWPNGQFAKSQAVRSSSSRAREGCFEVSLDCPIERWEEAEEPWLAGSLKWEWGFESVPVEVDTTERTLTILKNIYAAVESNKDYYVLNLLEEIDIPGEWYIDRKNLILYYYPSKDISKSDIRLAGKNGDDLLTFDHASFINVHGFEICEGINYGTLVKNNSHHIGFEDCRFERFSKQAAVIRGGDYITYKDCDFSMLMDGAVTIEKSGNRETLRGGEVKLENCYFTDCNRLNKLGFMIRCQPDTVGVKMLNCEFAGAPHQMIAPNGNNHVIENCEIYHGIKDSNDSGAIYAGRSWAVRGTILKNNLFHGNYGLTGASSDNWSIYWDDGLGGQIMISNLFYDMGVDSGIKGGFQDGIMDSNVFVDSKNAAFKNVSAPPTFDGEVDVYKHSTTLLNSAKTVPYQNPFWTLNFPALRKRADDPTYKHNNWYMVNNLMINCDGGFMDVANEFYENDFYRDYLNNIVENNLEFVDCDIVGTEGNYDFGALKELDIKGFKAPDIDKMGVKLSENREKYPEPSDFELIYPANGQKDMQMKNLEFVWRPTTGTVLNKITIATDENFENIVYEKEIYCRTADVPDIEWEYGETTYYWKVEAIDGAINSIGAQRCEKVFAFTTARDEALDMLSYERAKSTAEKLLKDAPVGEETGNVPQEIWDSLNNLLANINTELNSGKFISGGTLEDYIAQINAEVEVFKKKRKPGTVELLDYLDINASGWVGPDPNNIIRKDGSLIFSSTAKGSSNVYGYREIMPNYPIWKFNAIFNLSDLSSGWQAISLRASGATSVSWAGGYSYICIIKPDVIELQQFGKKSFYDTVPNTFIESGKEYTIEFGAYDVEEGVRLIFKVDGQTVFDKLDTENYNDVEGYISFVAPQNQPLILKKSY